MSSMPPSSPGSDHSFASSDLEMPIDPSVIRTNAQSEGFSREEAAVVSQLAQTLVHEHQYFSDEIDPMSNEELAEAIKDKATEEVEHLDFIRQEKELKELKYESKRYLPEADIFLDDLFVDEDLHLNSDPVDLLQEIDEVTLVDIEVDGIRKKKFVFSDAALKKFFDNVDPYEQPDTNDTIPQYEGVDVITCMCHHVELAVEIGKHLNGEDILNLALASRAFYNTIHRYLFSSIRTWIAYSAPEAGRIFNYKLYSRHLVKDPTGRTWKELKGTTSNPERDSQVRKVPGLKYLQFVLGRQRYCSEILAILARNGHRMPPTMLRSLTRLWFLMEIATTSQRQRLILSKELFSDVDLYNIQMFLMKLGMHFNDPVYGPSTWDLVQLMMGQKGLFPLWQLLTRKNYTRLIDILQLKIRYDFDLYYYDTCWAGQDVTDIHGVPRNEVGRGHCEGWGVGTCHLHRPDELLPVEAVRRGLYLQDHLTHMMIWGYFDWETGQNIVPSLEEMHIEDEEMVLSNVDTICHWKPRHVMKKNWKKLTREQQREIMEDEEDERLRALAWSCDGTELDDYGGPGLGNPFKQPTYSLEDEIKRGYIVEPQPKDHKSSVPDKDDKDGWEDFVNDTMIGMIPDVSDDEKMKAEAWNTYSKAEITVQWDWVEWLKQHQEEKARRRAEAGYSSSSSYFSDSEVEDDDDGSGGSPGFGNYGDEDEEENLSEEEFYRNIAGEETEDEVDEDEDEEVEDTLRESSDEGTIDSDPDNHVQYHGYKVEEGLYIDPYTYLFRRRISETVTADEDIEMGDAESVDESGDTMDVDAEGEEDVDTFSFLY